MATAKKATPKKKAAPKKQAATVVKSEFEILRSEVEGLGTRLDIMIQQLDAIRTLITPPNTKAKK